MTASNINVFNRLTGNKIESKQIFESLLDEYYDKFKVVYKTIKKLPKKYIDTIDCAKFVNGNLMVIINIDNDKELTKIYNNINILPVDKFDIFISKNDSDITIIIRDVVEE